MPCNQCASHNQRPFNGELAIHFPGLDGLDKPIVWVFPQLVVCLNCGLAQFTVPEKELDLLAERTPPAGASEQKSAPVGKDMLRMAKKA